MFTPRFAHARPFFFLGAFLLTACLSGSPGASAIPSASASAAASQPGPALAGHLVYIRTGGTYGETTVVFTANADGSDERQLSGLGDEGCCVHATRDGARVLFSTLAPDHRVTTATVNFDGSDRFVVPLPEGMLSLGPGPFSPDGTQIAFVGFEDPANRHSKGIYIGSADGTNLVQVTHGNDIPGDWSPDGTQLVFLRGDEIDDFLPLHLFVVNVDGSEEHQLEPSDVAVPCCWGYRWSPDGSLILFADAEGVLGLINPDGTDLTQLFIDAKVMHVRRYASTPTWSPDGAQIMFALSATPNPSDTSKNGLFVIEADGTGLTLVIGGVNYKREPSWVP
jgi:hypothetical protein